MSLSPGKEKNLFAHDKHEKKSVFFTIGLGRSFLVTTTMEFRINIFQPS